MKMAMTTDTINMLVSKRHVELEYLGIAPKLYYSAVKLIDRSVIFIIKDNKTYLFKNEPQKPSKAKSKKAGNYNSQNVISLVDISNSLIESYGIDIELSAKII